MPPSKNRGMPTSPPAAKRQKINLPSERTTDYLDLNEDPRSDDESKLEHLLKELHKSKNIVIIAGAGISVSAGIPDFRSKNGLFETLRKKHNLKTSGKNFFDASVYSDKKRTAIFHDMVCEMLHATRAAVPTPFHDMLATLATEGRLLRLYTQNVDGLDTSLESLATVIPLEKNETWPRTIQLHGTLDKMVCTKCKDVKDLKAELFDGGETPSCGKREKADGDRVACGKRSHGIGSLRPRMVLYNECNPDQEAINAAIKADLDFKPDAFIVVGTSLKIPGVKPLVRDRCKTVRRRNGFTAWINNADQRPKELGDCWDLVVNANSEEVARRAANFMPSETTFPPKEETSELTTWRPRRRRLVTAAERSSDVYGDLYYRDVEVARQTSDIARTLPRCNARRRAVL